MLLSYLIKSVIRLSLSAFLIINSEQAISQDDFKILNKKGNNELNANNYAGALSYFERAIECLDSQDSSNFIWTASIAGICAERIGEKEKAFHFFKIAIEYGTSESLIYEHFFELAEEKQDNFYIEQGLLAARVNLDNQYRQYTNKLLNFYVDNEMHEKTILVANELLESNPDHFNINFIKASALLKTGKESEAIAIFNDLNEKDPDNLNVNFQLGMYYYNKGSAKYDAAKEKYNKLKDPSISDYATYIRETNLTRPDYEKAIAHLEKVYEKNPNEQLKIMIQRAYNRIRPE